MLCIFRMSHEHKDRCIACWSRRSSFAAHSTELYPGTSIYVVTRVLRGLQDQFGPFRQPSWYDYGWELIYTLLGPESLRAITAKKSAVEGTEGNRVFEPDTTGLFAAVIQHSRRIYALPAITAKQSLELERAKFRRYCNLKLDKLSDSNDTSSSNESTTDDDSSSSEEESEHEESKEEDSRDESSQYSESQEKELRNDGTKECVVVIEDTTDETADDSRSEDLMDEHLTIEHSSHQEQEDSVEKFMQKVMQNNPSVSEEALRAVMEYDESLKENVRNIKQIEECLLDNRSSATCKDFPKSTTDFVTFQQANAYSTVHLPVDQVKELYYKGHSVFDNLQGWTCSCCRYFCHEEDNMQDHIARMHFLSSMGTNGWPSAPVQDHDDVSVEVDDKERELEYMVSDEAGAIDEKAMVPDGTEKLIECDQRSVG